MAKSRLISTRIIAKLESLRARANLSITYLEDIYDIMTQFSDSGSMTDVMLLEFEKIIDESLGIIDNIASDITKPISDNVDITDIVDIIVASLIKIISDNMSATDAIISLIGKNIDENTSLLDSILLLVDKIHEDAVNTTDSGSIINQDYVDISYFLENYIGDYETF